MPISADDPEGIVRCEAGGATVFGLFALLLSAVLLSLAIDVSNLYRQQNLMRLAADAAAHAGVVALARGGTPQEAEAAAIGMLEVNLPAALFGRMIADPATDLRALAYDAVSGELAEPGADSPPNTMLVRLQRSAAVANRIPTHALRLIGFDGWTTAASGVVTLVTTRRCPNTGGFFARGAAVLAQNVRLGAEFCLHSQNRLELPANLSGDVPPRVSLPMPTACAGNCDALGPAALNLVMPDAADHVLRIAEGFAWPGLGMEEKAAFFATRRLAADLEPLAEVGVDVRGLRQGSVVPLSALAFSRLREVPAGLVYVVTCARAAADIPADSVERIEIGSDVNARPMRDAALITTCPLALGPFARIEGALVIALQADAAAIAAAPGARFGGPGEICAPGNRSLLLTLGSLVLSSDLVGSGLGVVAGGDVALVAGSAGIVPVRGLAVHVGGALRVEGGQVFEPCPGDSDPVLPRLQVIAQVMPSLEGWVEPPSMTAPKLRTPGTAVAPLPTVGSRVDS